jgi:hypothetical protein
MLKNLFFGLLYFFGHLRFGLSKSYHLMEARDFSKGFQKVTKVIILENTALMIVFCS